jgi:peptidoglycan hydrolase-like protein with peptidoglycan-binding domain
MGKSMRRSRLVTAAVTGLGLGLLVSGLAVAAPPAARRPVEIGSARTEDLVLVRSRRGSVESERVAEVQRALRRDGYRVTVDGVYGRNTRSALLRYQARHGLRRTGEPDAATLRSLGIG